jgi:hypothetical protein
MDKKRSGKSEWEAPPPDTSTPRQSAARATARSNKLLLREITCTQDRAAPYPWPLWTHPRRTLQRGRGERGVQSEVKEGAVLRPRRGMRAGRGSGGGGGIDCTGHWVAWHWGRAVRYWNSVKMAERRTPRIASEEMCWEGDNCDIRAGHRVCVCVCVCVIQMDVSDEVDVVVHWPFGLLKKQFKFKL